MSSIRCSAWPFLPLLAILTGCSKESAESTAKYRAPDGFVVEEVAPAAQTGSLVAVTFDSLGRPVVSKEKKFPTILIDSDGDGKFETEKTFTDKVKNLQGMWFDGRTLYAVGQSSADDVTGLYKLEDTDGDDVADTMTLLNPFEMTMGEHGPHDIRRGPDGEPSVMLGNHTGVPPEYVDPASPMQNFNEAQLLTRYKDARGHAANIKAPGGGVHRLDRATGKYSRIASGFRNAYNHAYNYEGELFTFDSDMEWDINLPWYRGIRSLHVIPGGDYGWRTGSGKLAAYNLDTLPPMRDIGRGSPVGVEFYEHHAYPKSYRGAFFEGDWSRGRILVSNPVKSGATYSIAAEAKEFLHGEPLNVTDMEVGPDGCMYFTTGGRDTEGGLYRIRYVPGLLARFYNAESEPSGILKVVRQPQPQSSWGYAALQKAKGEMGEAWQGELAALAAQHSAASKDRVNALLFLERLGPKPDAGLVNSLSRDENADVRAAAVYVGSLHHNEGVVLAALADSDPFTRRRALEAIGRMGIAPDAALTERVYKLLQDPDRYLRYAARLTLERAPRELWQASAMAETNADAAPEAFYALTRTAKDDAALDELFPKEIAALRQSEMSITDKLRRLRAFQLTAIRRTDGAPAAVKKQISDVLLPQFPQSDERLNRELARTLAYAGQPEAIGKILAAMPKEDENTALQIHYVYCLRDIKSGWTPEEKRQLMNWYPKAAEWRGGASFTGYINLMFDSSLETFTDEEKKLAYAKAPVFAPLTTEAASRGGFIPSAAVVRGKGVQAISNEEIMEYQMFDPMTLKAKAANGREVFEKECAQCHRHGGTGKDFGPDLTTLASRFKKKDILESILWPSKTISDQYSSIIVETKDGELINALLVSEDAKRLVLKTAQIERPIEVPKSAVKSRRPSKISIMPENLLNQYGQNRIADLLAFLLTPATT